MPAIDTFAHTSAGMDSPLARCAEIVPDDGADLSHLTRAIYVGTAGDLRVALGDGTVVVLANAPVGWHPLRVARVFATATTAGNLVGGW